nr:RagB/SusD family nutrient uptake outer membrane protein [Prevotella sp. AM34-19LB]
MWNDRFRLTLVMGSMFFKNYYEADGTTLAESAWVIWTV